MNKQVPKTAFSSCLASHLTGSLYRFSQVLVSVPLALCVCVCLSLSLFLDCLLKTLCGPVKIKMVIAEALEKLSAILTTSLTAPSALRGLIKSEALERFSRLGKAFPPDLETIV